MKDQCHDSLRMEARYPLCIQAPYPSCTVSTLSIVHLDVSSIMYLTALFSMYLGMLSKHIQACYPLCMYAWICLWHFYAFLWMFYHGLYFFSKLHSTILMLSTNYKLLEVLTVGDGDDEVGWWWLVEKSESMRTCQCVWCYCTRSWNIRYSGGTEDLTFQLLEQ